MVNRTNQRSICVLGMHRSGTSCLTGIMQRFGVELGEVFESNPFNKKGNREHPRIMALNEAVLEYNGGAWNAPVEVLRWSSDHVKERSEILADICNRQSRFWGFKDPRFLLTRPFWLEAITPSYIATFRHPVRVALSLQQRNKMNLDDGFELWYAYNLKLHEILLKESPPLINFDLEPEEYLKDVSRKLISIGLPELNKENAIDFFDVQLRHHASINMDEFAVPKTVSDLYTNLLDYYVSSTME